MKRTLTLIAALTLGSQAAFAQLDLDMTVQYGSGNSLVQSSGAATTTSMKGFVGTFVGVTDEQISDLIFSDFSALVAAFRPHGSDANAVNTWNLGSDLVSAQFRDGDTTSPVGDANLASAETYFWAFNQDTDFATLQGLDSYTGDSLIAKDSGSLGFRPGGADANSFFVLRPQNVPADDVLVGGFNAQSGAYSMTNIPEPSSFALIFGALAGLMMFRRRRA